MTLFAFSALINGLTGLALAIFIFFKSRKSVVNKTFILLCLSVVVWSLSYFFWQISQNASHALFWSRALMAGAIFIPIFYLHFILAFLGKIKENTRLLIIVYIFALASLASNFTPFFVKNVEPELSFAFWPKPGIVFHPFLATWFILIVYSFYLLVKRYQESGGIEKSQIIYILTGTLIAYIGGTTNYFLWYGIPIKPYGNILASAYVWTIAYAIVVHRLMDIKLVMRRSTVWLGSVLTVFLPAVAILTFVNRFYPDFLTSASLMILVLGVSVFPPIKNYFYRLANKYFFSSLYDSREVISTLTDKLRSTLEASRIYGFIAESLKNAFHSKAISILTYDEKNDNYLVQYNDGFDIGSQRIFPNDKPLYEKFARQNKTLVVEEIKNDEYKESASTIALLKRLGVEILTPLNVKDKTIGLIVLSSKESRDMYNNEDLQVLEMVGGQAAIAIENALLYEETRQFSQTLQKEVERQTRELQKAYQELKVLDKAKSEFISMASHQLRTPLSAIKGYISMMIEGSYGQPPEKMKEKLQNVFYSNERLIKVVNDLLDISRIEMGKMEIEKEKTQIEELLQSCYEEMKIGAEKKKLKFVFAKPKKPLPKIEIDALKIRQVILNLIDNAIRYTQRGEITIKVKSINSKIRIEVKDTGEGLTKKEQRDIFEGFTRGSAGIAYFIEGAGLGLYVAKKFLDLHEGKMWAESKGKGRGSAFFVELPVK